MRAGKVGAFIELHGNVCAEQIGLYFDAACRRETMLRAINEAAERHAVHINFAKQRQRPNLEASTICEHRAGPFAKGVQTAQFFDALSTWAQHQVISVAKNDIGARLMDLIHVKRFDRARGSDRHESWRANVAARRFQPPRSRCAIRSFNREIKYGH